MPISSDITCDLPRSPLIIHPPICASQTLCGIITTMATVGGVCTTITEEYEYDHYLTLDPWENMKIDEITDQDELNRAAWLDTSVSYANLRAGCILYLKPLQEIHPRHTWACDLNRSLYNHPVLVLNKPATEDDLVEILLVCGSSFLHKTKRSTDSS